MMRTNNHRASRDAFLASLEIHAPHEEELIKLFLRQHQIVHNTLIKCNSGAQEYFNVHGYAWALRKEPQVLRVDGAGFHVQTNRGIQVVPLAILDTPSRELAKAVRRTFSEERAHHFEHKLKDVARKLSQARNLRNIQVQTLTHLEMSHAYMERHVASATKGNIK